MNIRPLADRVIIKVVDPVEQVQGGIIIPDTAQEKPQEGEIIAVGPGEISESGNRVELEVKKGDRVLYSKYSGTEVNVDGEDYLIVRESDILAIL